MARWLEDTGTGDGRVVALTNGVYRIPSIGIDKVAERVEMSRTNMQHFRRIGILDTTPLVISAGDFLDDKTYKQLGLRFEDITTFFNYQIVPFDIAAKITVQSPKWTVLLYESNDMPPEFAGLTLEKTITLKEPVPLPHSILQTKGCWLYVYRKVN